MFINCALTSFLDNASLFVAKVHILSHLTIFHVCFGFQCAIMLISIDLFISFHNCFISLVEIRSLGFRRVLRYLSYLSDK